MAEKLSIERYKLFHGKQHCDIFLDGLDIATVYEEEYLHPLAAAPLMLEALEVAYSEIFRLITQSRMIQELNVDDSGDVLKTISAAIAAAKGE
jgi:hypothetical protein